MNFAEFVEKVLYGLQVAAIGLAVVFFGLALLIFFIWIMARAFQAINGKREGKTKEAAARAEITAPAAAEPLPVAAPVETVQDAELIAVIAAAIAAFDNSGKRLVVRKVRRVAGWNKSAREEQVYRF